MWGVNSYNSKRGVKLIDGHLVCLGAMIRGVREGGVVLGGARWVDSLLSSVGVQIKQVIIWRVGEMGGWGEEEWEGGGGEEEWEGGGGRGRMEGGEGREMGGRGGGRERRNGGRGEVEEWEGGGNGLAMQFQESSQHTHNVRERCNHMRKYM